MSKNLSKPIFIHSLFRAGSTYLFEVFRRSNGYWCYQEPENEILLPFVDDPSSVLSTTDNLNITLRHPKLDKPYLAEFVPIISEIRSHFQKEFAYDTFFLPSDIDYPELHHFLDMLIERAHGRPVLQFCRSTGRMKWMRHHFDAAHLFLWRRPWDQWWSYKVSSYFDTANLMILNARLLPPVFQEIRRAVRQEEFHSRAIGDEIAHFSARSLTSTQSYLVFYALWLHAMYEGFEAADAILSIDGLSRSAEYRQKALDELASLGITGVDFSDCNVHQGWFGEKDASFFRPIELRVHEIFLRHDYSEEMLRTITSRHQELDAGASSSAPMDTPSEEGSEAMKEDLERARQLVRQLESDASAMKKVIVGLRRDVAGLEIDRALLQSIYNSFFWKASTPLRETYWKIRSLYRILNRKVRASGRESDHPATNEPSIFLSAPMDLICPVCLKSETTEFFDQDWLIAGQRYRLLRCASCGSISTFPPPSDSTLENVYRTSFDYRWYQDHYDAKLRDCRMRIREYGPRLGKRVLDFGGGVGYFSKAAAEAGLESITYDPYVNASLPAGGNWDSVVALHVLEHSNDLDRTVSQIKNFLAPGGRVIIAVPNAAGLGYQKLGMRWVWAQPPLVHVFHFTAAGLKALLARHGFSNMEESYHERWDANLYCDLEQVEQFRQWDADWGRHPFNAFQLYRRWIARRNTKRRFEGLEKALATYEPQSNAYAELQVTGILKR